MQENDARFLFMFVLCQKGVKKARKHYCVKKCKKACLQSQKNKKIKKGRSSVCPREEEDKEKKTQRRRHKEEVFLECFSPQTKCTQTTHFLYSFCLGEDTF